MKMKQKRKRSWRICFFVMLATLLNCTILYASQQESPSASAPVVPDYFGDINEDGNLDLKDAKLYLEVALGIVDYNSERSFYCDADRDDISLEDAQEILKMALGITPVRLIKKPDYTVLYQGIHSGTDMSFALRIRSEEQLHYLIQDKARVNGFEQYTQYVPEDFFEQQELLFFMLPVHTDNEACVEITKLLYNGTYFKADFTQELECKNQSGDAYVCMLALKKESDHQSGESEIAVTLHTKGETNYFVGNDADMTAIGYLSQNCIVINSIEELQAYAEGLEQQLFVNSREEIEHMIALDGMDYEATLEEARKNAKAHVVESLGEILEKDEHFFEEQTLIIYQREKKSGTRYVKLKLSEDKSQLEIVEERVYLENGEPLKSPNWLSWLIKKLMGKKSSFSGETTWRITEIIVPKEAVEKLEIIVQ